MNFFVLLIVFAIITILTGLNKPETTGKKTLPVYPYPKVLTRLSDEVKLKAPLEIVVSKPDEEVIESAIKILRTRLYERFRIPSDVKLVNSINPDAANCIVLILNQNGEMDEVLNAMQVKIPDKDEDGTFVLSTKSGRVIIAARDPSGILYGVYDLLQLSGFENDALTIPGVHIEDWPTLSMRGYMFENSQSLGVQKMNYYYTLLDKLSQARINTVFPNIADGIFFCMEIPGRMELSRPRAFRNHPVTDFHPFTKQQLLDLVSYGKKRGIEFVPMIQSIGHARLYTDIYPDLADPGSIVGSESSLDPFHPGTEELLEDIYKFCSEIYSSPWMHVAGDEVRRYGNSEGTRISYENAGGEATGLTKYEWAYKRQIETIDRILKKYGKKQIIKTDILLKHPKILDLISKDIIVDMNNHYRLPIKLEDPELFVNKGFKMIGCPAIMAAGGHGMPSTYNIGNVNQWTKIIQDLDLIGSRLCLWDPERVIDDACWFSILYSGSLFWEGTTLAEEGGTFDHQRFFDAYTQYNFGLPPESNLVGAIQAVQNNAPRRTILNKFFIQDQNGFYDLVKGMIDSKEIEGYNSKLNDYTGVHTINAESSIPDYVNKLNQEMPEVVQSLMQSRNKVRYSIQEYDALLLMARIELFIGKLGKLYIEENEWPLDNNIKRAINDISSENDQILQDILEARDHWRYEDNPGRAGFHQGYRTYWFLHYFYNF
ncbi:family 20 glycosylhydrolase, partial [Bacteroidota bacterium]